MSGTERGYAATRYEYKGLTKKWGGKLKVRRAVLCAVCDTGIVYGGTRAAEWGTAMAYGETEAKRVCSTEIGYGGGQDADKSGDAAAQKVAPAFLLTASYPLPAVGLAYGGAAIRLRNARYLACGGAIRCAMHLEHTQGKTCTAVQ
eukprot:503024-Rhodomonas_salina.3